MESVTEAGSFIELDKTSPKPILRRHLFIPILGRHRVSMAHFVVSGGRSTKDLTDRLADGTLGRFVES